MTEKEKVFGELFLRMLNATDSGEDVKLNDEEANLLFGKLVEMVKNLTEENKLLKQKNKYEGITFMGLDYEIIKTTDTFGGNLITRLRDVRRNEEEEMIFWKKGY